jgi:hypothetical protein
VQDVQAVEDAGAVGAEEVVALAAELLGDHGEVDHAAAQAAHRLGEGHAQQPHLDEGVVQLVGVARLGVAAADVLRRGDTVQHGAHAVAQQVLFFGEGEIHGDPV